MTYERLAHALKSGGHGFESRRVLGFYFLLLCFPTFLHQWGVLNQVPPEVASLIVKALKIDACCAAWAKSGSINSDWEKCDPGLNPTWSKAEYLDLSSVYLLSI